MSTFDEVLKVFGGSIFPEDFRADLETVQQHLVSTRPDEQTFTEASASYHLVHSLYHAFNGNNNQASSELYIIVSHLDDLPLRWQVRCLSYAIYHLTIRRYPPWIQFRSDLLSLSASFHDIIYSWEQSLEFGNQLNDLMQQIDLQLRDSDKTEAKVMMHLNTNHMTLTLNSFVLHPFHPERPWIPQSSQDDTARTARNKTDFSNLIESILIDNEYYHLRINVALRAVRALSGFDSDAAVQKLSQTLDDCTQRQDGVGEALCKMLEADMIASPPFSSPIALNLIALDGTSYNCENLNWDRCEHLMELRTNEKVDALYTEAFDLFKENKSGEGCAAIILRQCAFLLGRILRDDVHDASEYRMLLASVERRIDTALNFSKRSETLTHIIQGHKTLLAVLKQDDHTATALMTEIGEWGKTNDSDCVAHFIGFLVTRFGRRLLEDHGHFDVAQACFHHAQALFSCLGDPVALFQTINQEAELHHELNDVVKTREMLIRGIEAMEPAFTFIDARIAETSNERVREILTLKRESLPQAYDIFVRMLLKGTKDSETLDMWVQRTATWKLGHDHGFESLWQFSQVEGAFTAALLKAQHYLDSYDVDSATETLSSVRRQIDDLAVPQSSKALNCVIASFLIGDRPACMHYSFYQTDDLDVTETKPVPTSPALWCRNKYSQAFVDSSRPLARLTISAIANDWPRATKLLRNIEAASPEFFEMKGPDNQLGSWIRCFWAGLIAENTQDLTYALQKYLVAENHLTQRRTRTIGLDAKLSSLSTTTVGELYVGLSRVSLKCARAQIPIDHLTSRSSSVASVQTWEQAALLFIERGRARTLLENLIQRRSPQETETPITNLLLMYKQRLRSYLDSLPSASHDKDTLDELEQLSEELKDLTVNIPLNDVEYDLKPMDIAGCLSSCLDAHVLFVELAFSNHESMFIVATNLGIQYIETSVLRRIDIMRHAFRVMKGINDYKEIRLHDDGQLMPAEVDTVTGEINKELEELARLILGPIAALIRKHSHLVFSISGPLVGFPFAALPFDGSPLFLSAALSTVPSLAVYKELSSRPRSFIPTLATIVKSGLSKTEAPLPLAAIESMVTSNGFQTWPRRSSELTNAGFSEIMRQCTIMHIGTHGRLHPKSPWLSYISLQRKFRVIDLANINSTAQLVVFAACESGLGKVTGDEALGFARSILESGATAFLGALWEVDDLATMILMIYFYRAIRLQPPGASRTLAELWRVAMRDFYNTDQTAAEQMIDGLIEDLESCRANGRDPDKIVWKFRELLTLIRANVDVDFKHPFFYAPFVLTGFGELICEPPEHFERSE